MSVIKTKVVGTTFDNDDGENRQDIIAQYCEPGRWLKLVREIHNPYDPYAVSVHCEGKQIGFLSSDLARETYGSVEKGAVSAQILDVTGSRDQGQNLGVNIRMTIREE